MIFICLTMISLSIQKAAKGKYPVWGLGTTPTKVQSALHSAMPLEFKKVGTLVVKNIEEIESSVWALGCETLDRDLASWENYRNYIRPLGIRHSRLQGGWARTEIEKGVYNFDWLDDIVDDAHSLGLQVCLETSYNNKLYDVPSEHIVAEATHLTLKDIPFYDGACLTTDKSLVNFIPDRKKQKETVTSFRGFMIDAPRTPESMEYYFRLIDFLHNENFNSIIFRLTDNEGSAFQFTSHPELKIREGAFAAEEFKELIEYAQKKNIEIIPEIEAFGHSRYITETERYSFLSDGPAGKEFTAVCPVNDSTLALMKDMFTEIASVFPSKYFHIGCDEVNWGASELSKKALTTRSNAEIWADYVNQLDDYVKALGKTTIIWGDVPLNKEKELLDLLDKEIVIMDWNYWETDKAKIDSIAQNVLSHGFKLIGCPALSWCGWGARVGPEQLENISAYAEVYGKIKDPGNLGLILSHWVPEKFTQNSQWDTYAVAFDIIKSNGSSHYMEAIPGFVERHFGAIYDARWEEIYRLIYEDTPRRGCGLSLFAPWSSKEKTEAVIRQNKPRHSRLEKALELMTICRENVKRNKNDFEDLFLTVRFMEYLVNRHNGLLNLAHSENVDLQSAESYLQKVAREDREMFFKMDSAWRSGRRCTPDLSRPGYMWSIAFASDYSQYLSENPGEFLKIIQKRK